MCRNHRKAMNSWEARGASIRNQADAHQISIASFGGRTKILTDKENNNVRSQDNRIIEIVRIMIEVEETIEGEIAERIMDNSKNRI